ncbi:hypothetical protein LCGC14_1054780 [marine sediment metagenome]|uniref:PRC-barrel domain-containing protein n=1 Tax=marine sediment metagenome TaxID=412755 RepID=A0A0F9N9P5_9ZZZZ
MTDIIEDIPLIIKGSQVGVIEKIIIDPSTDPKNPWFKIAFTGTLIKELKNSKQLVRLLQIEGIHLGKP